MLFRCVNEDRRAAQSVVAGGSGELFVWDSLRDRVFVACCGANVLCRYVWLGFFACDCVEYVSCVVGFLFSQVGSVGLVLDRYIRGGGYSWYQAPVARSGGGDELKVQVFGVPVRFSIPQGEGDYGAAVAKVDFFQYSRRWVFVLHNVFCGLVFVVVYRSQVGG